MRNLRLIIFLIIPFALFSCQKDDEDTSLLQGEHLKYYELVKTYTIKEASNILQLISIVGSADIQQDISQFVISGVSVHYIEYQSTYLNNQSIILSGLVVTPNSISNKIALMSFQNGTIVKHNEAPSKGLNNLQYMAIHATAGLGIAICIPDYIGFGSSESYQHPYLNKTLFNSTITDMVKAVKEMDDLGILSPIELNGNLYITGYSLGGWATLTTHYYIENNPIEGMELIKSYCGSGSYNLIQMKDYLFISEDFVQPFYVPLMISGLKSTNQITGNYSLYFNSPYDQVTESVFNGSYSKSEINAQLSSNMQELLTTDLINGFDSDTRFSSLKNALIDNSQKAWKNTTPIHFYHGTSDIHVPSNISDSTYNDFLSLGQTEDDVTLTLLPELDHATALMPMYIEVLDDLIQTIQ